MKHNSLPPLKSLIYFEASARLQSFTRASVELNVTQGAVSRQIRQLEQFLGLKLFRRENRQIFLTDDGHNYFVSVSHVLKQLSEATDTLVEGGESDRVTLITSNALAAMYLLPRIPAFTHLYDDIQIRIVARDDAATIDQVDYDLALYYCRQPPKNCRYTTLLPEEVFPVCSPEYLERNRDQLASLDGLSSNLIWMECDEDWINWPEWLRSMDISIGQFRNRLVVNHYPMVIQAAIAGQGIALAWAHLVDNELAAGTLVKPINISLETGAYFYLMEQSSRPLQKNAQIFAKWLQENR